MVPTHLEKFTTPTPVLDQGFLRLVDVMGDDGSIVTAARVTTGKGRSAHMCDSVRDDGFCGDSPAYCSVCKTCGRMVACDEHGISDEVCEEGDRRLLDYMLAHNHASPFEFAEIVIHMRLPVYVFRQWVRHWSWSFQEYSMRYSEEVDAIQATAPDAWRLQSASNRQGSTGTVTEWPEGFVAEQVRSIAEFSAIFNPDQEPDAITLASAEAVMGTLTPGTFRSQREAEVHAALQDCYRERLRFGVAREQARTCLPLANYTDVYAKANLRDVLNMLALRLDPHAQAEIRAYAEVLATIVKAWVPLTWSAFEEHRLGAHTLSASALRAVGQILGEWGRDVQALAEGEGASEVAQEAALQARVREVFAGVPDRERAALLAALARST